MMKATAMVFVALLALPASARIPVHGHRGARAVLPENTLPAFQHAIEAGADFIELDVAVTKDDVLVVSHDPVLNEAICSAPAGTSRVIRENTAAELRRWDCGTRKNSLFPKQTPVPGAHIPTLDEVLDLARGSSVQFNIEIKCDPAKPQYTPAPERFAEMVLQSVRRHGLESRVLVQSFDFRTVRAMKKLAPSIRLAALFDKAGADLVAMAKEADAAIAAANYKLVTPASVKAAHEAGIQVVPWTVNDEQQWDAMIRAGVDGMITDDPARLIGFLKERGLR